MPNQVRIHPVVSRTARRKQTGCTAGSESLWRGHQPQNENDGAPANVKGGRLKTSVTAHAGRVPLVGTRTLALIVAALWALATPGLCPCSGSATGRESGDTNLKMRWRTGLAPAGVPGILRCE